MRRTGRVVLWKVRDRSGGPSQRSGTVWVLLPEVWKGRVTLQKVRDGSGDLLDVRDGFGDPPSGPG